MLAAAVVLGAPTPLPAADAPVPATFFIREYRIEGAHLLKRHEVEEAVYPYLGPHRSSDDVEKARSAIEDLYQKKGYKTVSVDIPEQQTKGGIVRLRVVEVVVGRLRVKGAHYFSPNQVKAQAPSMAEGKVLDFNQVQRDVVALNQLPDRRVTPTLQPGRTPGTVDVQLEVKDSSPLHGSAELNNRHSPNTTALRLNGAFSDGNLWQLGHSFGFSFQLAPQHLDDAKNFSAFYLARFSALPWFTLTATGTKNDSDVSTLGGSAVAGRGETLGLLASAVLPAAQNFFQSLSLEMDYKHFDQRLTLGGSGGTLTTPITYYPVTGTYSATLNKAGAVTEANFGVTFNFRSVGSGPSQFDNNRYLANGGFVYFKADLSHTHQLPGAFDLFGKIQGQIADRPLVTSEQFTGGGVGTVRGYLEAETMGDNGFFGTVELRTPSLHHWLGQEKGDWRIYLFTDAGGVTLTEALPGQSARFGLASYGLGTSLRLREHFTGSVDAAMPLTTETQTKAHEVRVTFRTGADF